ncbi:MAG: hypothetical protein NT128_08300, partial [Proteobacteria bacterium]|nr:hypothetical protein [Pseudomonadota bacterium]
QEAAKKVKNGVEIANKILLDKDATETDKLTATNKISDGKQKLDVAKIATENAIRKGAETRTADWRSYARSQGYSNNTHALFQPKKEKAGPMTAAQEKDTNSGEKPTAP